MTVENVLILMVSMGGIICALVGFIYKTLSKRIESVSLVHNNLAVDISEIKTNICWIKKKLDKV